LGRFDDNRKLLRDNRRAARSGCRFCGTTSAAGSSWTTNVADPVADAAAYRHRQKRGL